MSIPVIEYFYSAHSAYAYLGAPTLYKIAAHANARVVHRPFDFLPVIQASGAMGFKERSAAHIAYFFGRELKRWGQWRALPIMEARPTFHDNPLALASGAILAARDPDRLSLAILQAHWRDDADIADPQILRAIAADCDEDATAVLETAGAPQIQMQFRENTAEAVARGIFGSPTYFVGGDMFYGQDRLEMVERALATPFAP
ncbi:2-hydroxychromene-2-carboxylate isomerase [Sulfitobacter guttiformis]|uniref:2-hydroxychromene-2-carboxylate isomerase n=1 Tax=Sulfitobacter guttiformis TaxID=74349 RepID=A0A420DPI6_9RHOB|nr:2-hydroxychromene-2-carboxylate isomerase [Sulfitobacter guttiformis]KIN73448.1 DSBA oxidoreductase [Sulfitobacter guttiformis KCTC 32187]RKE96110.1 2-hydroxychromene-2-carboxylate isomerase [Sulfitobacter guttiformis]